MSQYDVFISYKREDREFAQELYEKLTVWHHDVWMDIHSIPKGAYWPDEINQGLSASQVVIGLMSPRAVESRNVKNEWDWAIVNGKPLLLLMIESCNVPVNYISINYIDFTQDRDNAFSELRATLESPGIPAVQIDPYRKYLQALYDRINTYLAHTIITKRSDDNQTPEPIHLRSERTTSAVDALFEKREEVDPLFMIGGINQKSAQIESDFRAAFDYFEGRVLLLGEPGSGKTITLLHFGRDAVVQRIQDSSKPLPILGVIPTWDAHKQPSVDAWLATSYGAHPDAEQIVREGHALLLLDGLDELGVQRKDPITKKPFDPRPRFMNALPKNNQIVITCRVKDYEDIGSKIMLKGAVSLQPLDDVQIRDYLRDLPDLWAALEADEELRQIARTPLLLSLFAFAYQDQGEEASNLRDLRHSPGDLRDAIFERYVKRRYEHEQRKLHTLIPFSLEDIHSVLGKIAMWNVSHGVRPEVERLIHEKKTLPRKLRRYEDNIIEWQDFERVLGKKNTPSFIEVMVKLHLIVPQDNKEYRFIHLLLRDFFAYNFSLANLRNPECYQELTLFYPNPAPATALSQLKDDRALNPLLEAMNDPDPKIRFDVIHGLGSLGGALVIEVLVKALGDPDSEVRRVASEWLPSFQDEAANLLFETLESENSHARSIAAELLAEFGQSRVFECLLKMMQDEDSSVRESAVRGLWFLGDARGVEPLVDALNDSDATVRYYVVEAISEWTAELKNDRVVNKDDSADALKRLTDLRTVNLLIAALNDTDARVRAQAADALSAIQDTRAVTPLISALSDEAASVRAESASSLGFLRDNRALASLVNAVNDEDPDVRASAAFALGMLGDNRAVGPLAGLLTDTSARLGMPTSEVAIHALERIGTPEALAAVEAWRAEQNSTTDEVEE